MRLQGAGDCSSKFAIVLDFVIYSYQNAQLSPNQRRGQRDLIQCRFSLGEIVFLETIVHCYSVHIALFRSEDGIDRRADLSTYIGQIPGAKGQ